MSTYSSSGCSGGCNPCVGKCTQTISANTCNSCDKTACSCPPPIIVQRPVVRNGLCVVPVYGVTSMPEQGHVAMPVEGAEVPNNAYYRKLIKCGKLRQVDCETGCAASSSEWTGRLTGSRHHDFCGAGVVSIWTLLTQSQSGSAGVYSIDIDLQRNDIGSGVILTMENTNSTMFPSESRSWKGADDGLGNLTPATDFNLVLQAGDCAKVSWSEIN